MPGLRSIAADTLGQHPNSRVVDAAVREERNAARRTGRRAGRPSRLPTVESRILAAIAAGEEPLAAAAEQGVSRATWYRWLHRVPGLESRVHAARKSSRTESPTDA